MAQLGEAVTRYHKLLEQPEYRDTAWIEQFQEQMRQQHLTESGRLLAPVLRPHFVSKRQLESLTRVAAHMAEILDHMAELAFASPALLSRLQMLPAEKMLAAVPSGYSRFGVTSSLDLNLQNGSLSLQGLNACNPSGLAWSNPLADLFLELPIVKEFKRGRYKLSKLGGPKHLLSAVQAAWRQFGGKTKPCIAVVELGQEPAGATTEGLLLVESLNQQGGNARLVSPEQLRYSNGRLAAGDFVIDVVFRRLITRELLMRWDLSHPLLQAYRDSAVCVVNSFRSEFALRRSLFDLLTDENVTTHLPAADRKLIRNFVSWTRVVSPRKTKHLDDEVDLPDFIIRRRENLVLLPCESSAEHRIFVGAEMTEAAWDRALKVAMRSPYVVQERPALCREVFPIYQYGELRMKEAEVAVHSQVLNGEMQSASAVLQTCLAGAATHLAVAPVLLLEEA